MLSKLILLAGASVMLSSFLFTTTVFILAAFPQVSPTVRKERYRK